MNRLTILLLAHTLACAPCEQLADVPLIDADNQQRALWLEAVETFSTWVDVSGVCLSEVRIVEEEAIGQDGELTDDLDGRYHTRERAISVRASAMPRATDLGDVGYHELCHALDHQQAHRSLHGLPQPFAADDYFYGAGSASQRREMFAYLCSYGPETARRWALSAEACGYPELAESAQQLLDELFLPDAPGLDAAAWEPAWEADRELDPLPFVSADMVQRSVAWIYHGDYTIENADGSFHLDLVRNEVVQGDAFDHRDTFVTWARDTNGERFLLEHGLFLHPAYGRARSIVDDPPGVPSFRTLVLGELDTPDLQRPVAGVCGAPYLSADASVAGLWFFGATSAGLRWSHLPGPPVDPEYVYQP